MGHSLVAVLADDEPAVLLAALVHDLGVLIIGDLIRRGYGARGGQWLCAGREIFEVSDE